MRPLLRKMHAYAGLLAFAGVTVYGLTGIAASFRGSPAEKAIALHSTTERAFVIPQGATDRQIADRVCDVLKLPLARPVQQAALQHNPAGGLVLDLWHVNGHHKVTFADGRIRVEDYRASLGRYLSVLHMTTAAFHSGDWRMNAWARYNELSLWCLAGLLISGSYLWIASRGRPAANVMDVDRGVRAIHRYAALPGVIPLAGYFVSGLRMAHRNWFTPGGTGIWNTVARLHRTGGFGNGSTGWDAWGVLVAAMSLGLVVLGATGLYLGLAARRERAAGIAVLMVGLGFPLYLIISMRI